VKASKNVTCVNCGTVYFPLTKAEAELEVKKYNEFYDGLSQKQRSHYNGPSSIDKYMGCKCGNGKFRPFKKGDCPDGVTIQPVIWEQA
jgi:hypothetical protein